MKIKWYISTLVISLVFWGICHNQMASPNQEILVQFNNVEVTAEQSETTISAIKQQLQSSGVENIQVFQDSNGSLKISYYSRSDVQSIKKILSEGDNLVLDYKSLKRDSENEKIPSDKKNKNYNLDVYELHQKTNENSNSAGTFVLTVKHDFDRMVTPNLGLHSNEVAINSADGNQKQAFKVNKTIVTAIDNTSNASPEVRAGPSKFWKVMVFMN